MRSVPRMTCLPTWSVPCVHDSGCCERRHFLDTASSQDLGATLERRSGCGYIIHEYDYLWRQPLCGAASRKRIFHILSSSITRKIDLRRRVADAPEQRCDRWSEMDGEPMRLVEPAPEFAPGME